MIQLFKNSKIDFLGMRYPAFALSAVLLVLGIVGMWRISTGKAALAIDFAGGSSLIVKLEKEADIGKMRGALKEKMGDVTIQQINEGAEYLIRIGAMGEVQEKGEATRTVTDQALNLLEESLEENAITGSSSEEVGPSVSRNLRVRSMQAVGLALVGILFYIMIRFGQRFSVGAVVATLHDILAVIGLLVLFQVEFSLLIVVALLTIAGYSLNDTVVVYDRIRENQRSNRTRPHKETINASLNEVLARTVNTSLTTLVVLGSLLIFGGEVFEGFSIALITGVLVGTYSSVFVASPLVYEWNLRSPPR